MKEIKKQTKCHDISPRSLSVPLPVSFLAEILSKEMSRNSRKLWYDTAADKKKIYPCAINCKEQTSFEPSSVQFVAPCHPFRRTLQASQFKGACKYEDLTLEHIICICLSLEAMRRSIFGERWPSVVCLNLSLGWFE